MKVKLVFLGILSEYVRPSELEVELPRGAAMKDALKEVGRRFGEKLPATLWKPGEDAFTSLVSTFLDGKDVVAENPPLKEGSEVIFLTMIAGGQGSPCTHGLFVPKKASPFAISKQGSPTPAEGFPRFKAHSSFKENGLLSLSFAGVFERRVGCTLIKKR